MSAETPDIMDPRIARARAMREAGAETAEIARACGVTVSTIYRWAEAHGFRVRDLEAAAWAASGRGAPSPHAEFPALSRDLHQDMAPHAEGGPGSGPGFQIESEAYPPSSRRTPGPRGSQGADGSRIKSGMTKEDEAHEDAPEITAEQWGQMARSLKQRALALTGAGRLRQAEQALRLAERYDRMRASAPQPEPEPDGDYYRNELIRKLTRLQQHLLNRPDEAEPKPGEAFSPEPGADVDRSP